MKALAAEVQASHLVPLTVRCEPAARGSAVDLRPATLVWTSCQRALCLRDGLA